MADRSSEYLSLIRVMYGRVTEHQYAFGHDLRELSQHLLIVLNVMGLLAGHFESIALGDITPAECESAVCSTIRSGSVGRPPYQIDKKQIASMAELGFSFQSMAKFLGVSTRTLRRHRQQLGLPLGQEVFCQLTDSEVDEQKKSYS